MSWSFSAFIKREESDIEAGLDLLRNIDRSGFGNSDCVKERDEQIDAAINLAYRLFGSDLYANAEEVGVNLSGHANPEHKLQSGWANDTITIQVYIKKYKE